MLHKHDNCTSNWASASLTRLTSCNTALVRLRDPVAAPRLAAVAALRGGRRKALAAAARLGACLAQASFWAAASHEQVQMFWLSMSGIAATAHVASCGSDANCTGLAAQAHLHTLVAAPCLCVSRVSNIHAQRAPTLPEQPQLPVWC